MSNLDALSELDALISEEWQFRMRENPLWATSCGDHRFNDRLPLVGEEHEARRAAVVKEFQQRLRQIEYAALPPLGRLNYDIFARDLEVQLEEFRFGLYYMPVSRLSGFQIYLPDLVMVTPFQSLKDYQNYLKRLNGLQKFFDDMLHLMRQGMEKGYIPALAALQGIQSTVTGQIIDDPAKSPFYAPFKKFPTAVPASTQESLRASALGTIQEVVLPSYQALLRFLQDEYLPSARQAIAASALPDGADYYAFCVRRFTTLSLTPQQVHETGLREVRRIRAEMDDLIHKIGFQGSGFQGSGFQGSTFQGSRFHEFVDFLRSEPRFYTQTPDALLKEVAWIMKRMEGELPRLFKTLPRTPFGMRQIPDYLAPNSTSAYYFPSSGDGKTAGFYYVNTYDLKSRPLFEYEALSFHEAVPGHHLQLALQMEMTGVPDFRRFADVTAFIEGWALYAERLGLEVGFYTDPYSDFGRLTFEIWRACRLVVDTGMHALGWSRQQAIDYMAENSALSHLNIANEVDRYIAWPGQALAYKMGELKIRELRRQAEQILGSRFDLREFHERLLENGAIPLDALEKHIKQWIETPK
jgi:uncharacterized protein (DUF885 family)